jgi:broad specificity phosphatase PhoE
MLQARVVDCVRGLRGDCVALVTHAGAIRALLGYWLQLPIGDWSQLPLAFGSITLLEIDATGGDQRDGCRASQRRRASCATSTAEGKHCPGRTAPGEAGRRQPRGWCWACRILSRSRATWV